MNTGNGPDFLNDKKIDPMSFDTTHIQLHNIYSPAGKLINHKDQRD